VLSDMTLHQLPFALDDGASKAINEIVRPVPYLTVARSMLFYGAMKLRPILLALTALAALSVAYPARANFVETIDQVGADVVATGSGTIDLTDLVFFGHGTGTSGIFPTSADVGIGSPASQSIDGYTGISGPTSFGPGPGRIPSNSGSGDDVQLIGASHLLGVPSGYVTGTSLSDSSTYTNTNFALLGIDPGTYTWTWGTGDHADSFTLEIGSVPDGGSTVSLLGLASLGLVALRRKLRC
jgi:hypothetical protein